MSTFENTQTLVGNLTADPEVRYTPAGAAVATFTLAHTPRTFDRQANQWRDGDTLFIRCNVWRDLGEHAHETLSKGTRVVVVGALRQRTFETREGDKRTTIELDVDDLGPSLRFATATVNKATRTSPTGPADDPWASAPTDQ